MSFAIARISALALFAALSCATPARAATEAEALREELNATRAAFETRIAALEARLRELESTRSAAPEVASERLDVLESRLQQVEVSAAPPASPGASAFNPQMSLILAGNWSNLAEAPQDYRLAGFVPAGGESGPGERGFNLGETEMTLSASIDPLFYGQATFAIDAADEISAEEAFVRTSALSEGLSAQFGRFYSGLGYQNGQHAHTWDFVDIPLVYQALFGGQYKNEGAQLRWLAPLNTFVELGAEIGNGRQFPGADQGNGVGAWTLFANTGNDIGDSASWKAGLAWLETNATNRVYQEADGAQPDLENDTAFDGDSSTWSAYLVYKWAPDGNSRTTNFKLQAEYLARREDGTLTQQNATRGTGATDYRAGPSGWYVQGIYQFMPSWRTGLRYEQLDSGNTRLRSLDGVLRPADFPALLPYDPERVSLMLDWSPTEFSRLRLQYAHEDSAPGARDRQIFLQYLMSLGAHGAHQF